MKKLFTTFICVLATSLAIAGPVKIIKTVESNIPVKVYITKDSVSNIRMQYLDNKLYDNVKYELDGTTLRITALSPEVYNIDPSDFKIRVCSPVDVNVRGIGDMDVLVKEKTSKKKK